tara:strand:+ start:94 stop:417 length:324 start_codon:yes stop_codon:yes gene_type:complete
MPYTQEELNKLPFYQNLIDKDEQYYLIKKQKLVQESDALGAANDGSQLVRHKGDGSILLFEDPYENKLPEDPETKIIYNMSVKKLKINLEYGSVLDEVVDREFKEIT